MFLADPKAELQESNQSLRSAKSPASTSSLGKQVLSWTSTPKAEHMGCGRRTQPNCQFSAGLSQTNRIIMNFCSLFQIIATCTPFPANNGATLKTGGTWCHCSPRSWTEPHGQVGRTQGQVGNGNLGVIPTVDKMCQWKHVVFNCSLWHSFGPQVSCHSLTTFCWPCQRYLQ